MSRTLYQEIPEVSGILTGNHGISSVQMSSDVKVYCGSFAQIPSITGWWCNNHLEKYEFVKGKDYPINISGYYMVNILLIMTDIFWKNKKMFQTTNQIRLPLDSNRYDSTTKGRVYPSCRNGRGSQSVPQNFDQKFLHLVFFPATGKSIPISAMSFLPIPSMILAGLEGFITPTLNYQ